MHLDAHGQHTLGLDSDAQIRRLPGDREIATQALLDHGVGGAQVQLLGFLVRDADQPYAHPLLALQVLERAHHRRQSALHVVGAAPDQVVALHLGLELLWTPGHDVEMAVQDHAGGAVAGRADLGHQHRKPVVLQVLHLDVPGRQPAANEPGGGHQLLGAGRDVLNQPLGQDQLIDHAVKG